MAELRDSDYVNTIIQRLQAAHFHTRAIRVNAEELPMVRTAKDDAKYGKQILLLLGLHPDKVAEEFAIIQRVRPRHLAMLSVLPSLSVSHMQ